MFRKLFPREEKFFILFEQSAALIVEGSQEFCEMLKDMPNCESHSKKIKEIEHKADDVTHSAVDLLHKTFITPLDREDIHELIKKMDDIIDLIDGASQKMNLYEIKEATPELKALAEICLKSAHDVKKMVNSLQNMGNREEIIARCIEINRLENEADQVHRAAMAKLFREETDIRQLIKLKEIYALVESATDRCEDVANIVEGIVVEYS